MSEEKAAAEKSFGQEAARLHRGGPDYGGQSWRAVGEELCPDLDSEEAKWKARDAGRAFLKGKGWKRWGVPVGSADDNTTRASVKYDGKNVAHATIMTDRILSTEQLQEATGLSDDEWIIERQEFKKYEAQRKHEEKDLTWMDGRMTGWLKDSGMMLVQELLSIKVQAVRRHPEPVHPVIHPVSWDGEIDPPPPPKDRPFRRHLIWGDAQAGFRRRVHDAQLKPFHDRGALDLVLQVAAAAKPDEMHITGDTFDSTEWTDKFLRSPEFYFTFQPALYEVHWWLVQYLQTATKVLMHQGNHEKRLPDAVKRHLPFAYGLRPAHMEVVDAPQVMSFRFLLNLDELGVEWISDYPNDRYWLAEKLALYHGSIARKNPLSVAKALAQGNISIINLHNHRLEMCTETRQSEYGPYTVWGISVPCTCHVDHRVPGHRHTQHWSKGLIIVDVFDHEYFQIQPVPFENNRAIWNGLIFEARDRLPELEEAHPRWNW